MANEVRKTIKNVGDAIKEGVHRGNADAEHEGRAEFGDVMTPGEKAQSVAREVEEDTKAGIDRAKREVRNRT
jgi:hypothetical protein